MSLVLVLLGLVTTSERVAPVECASIYREIQLTQPRKVDGVRVVLRGNAEGAASRVTVMAGRYERALTVMRGGLWGLKFGPALDASSLLIAVEPSAALGVCVEKIILLCGSEEVAVVTP
jgi:hypothetical protein